MPHLQEIAPEARILRECARVADEQAWTRFLATYRDRLRREVRGALARASIEPLPERCEDLEQEVFCRLLERDRRALASFRGRSAGEAHLYLRRIVRRVVVDALRSPASRRALPDPAHPQVDLAAGAGRELGDRRGCPEARLLARERGRLFVARCRELLGPKATPARLRVVSLAFLVGLPSAAIAERLGEPWSRAAIDSLLHRLRRKLERAGSAAPRRRGGPTRGRRSRRRAAGARGGARLRA